MRDQQKKKRVEWDTADTHDLQACPNITVKRDAYLMRWIGLVEGVEYVSEHDGEEGHHHSSSSGAHCSHHNKRVVPLVSRASGKLVAARHEKMHAYGCFVMAHYPVATECVITEAVVYCLQFMLRGCNGAFRAVSRPLAGRRWPNFVQLTLSQSQQWEENSQSARGATSPRRQINCCPCNEF